MTVARHHVNFLSLLIKHLIKYWWMTWADWYLSNIIITTGNTISVNIVCTAAPVKRKTIWKDASYTVHTESSSQKLKTRRGVTKLNLQKRNANYVYLLSSMGISKVLYANKTCVYHRHQNLSPSNTNITYHLGAASTWNAVMDDILN